MAGALSFSLGSCAEQPQKEATQIHSVSDLAHLFSFYSDHRFVNQYIEGGQHTTNWANLYDLDLANTNLLILLGCDNRIEYTDADVATIKEFARSGGGVVMLSSEDAVSQNKLIAEFGVTPAGLSESELTYVDGSEVVSQGKATAFSYDGKKWNTVVKDGDNKSILSRMRYGKGEILIGSRRVAGSNPNASDSINCHMWKPLLREIASGKEVDAAKPVKGLGIADLSHRENHETFTLSYNDYLKPFADAMLDINNRCLPVIEARMGVPLSKGMGSEISLLATDGGGFSSGTVIALAVWWGGFPEVEDSMIEFITHESVHSWVLPYAEVWNEPIATYVGNLVMMDMGHEEEALRRIESTIKRAEKYDPKMDKYDLSGNAIDGSAKLSSGEANEVHWGKTYWIFEQLRKDYPDIISRYFKAKREMVADKKLKSYDMNNTIAVLNHATGKDLYPWFRKHGFDVSKSKAEI